MNNEQATFEAGQDFEEKEERDEYDDLAQDPDYKRNEN